MAGAAARVSALRVDGDGEGEEKEQAGGRGQFRCRKQS